MIQSGKRRLIGGIALALAIVFGSSVAATSLRADSGWSWETGIIGGVVGGLIGSKSDVRFHHRPAVGFATVVHPFYDGPFILHHHNGVWHRHPWQHRRGWHVWLGHHGPWYVHPDRYHHRQWHAPQARLRSWSAHPPGHQHRQWHEQRVHQQPRHVHVQRHQHRHRHGHQAHQQPWPTQHVYRHGHAHRW
ncbi:MAG: hypothetical protein OXI20_18030 [Rhodospirillales bacterium]|nr:hypothetical protein [Rhodospirillales bacterium]